MPEGLGVYGVLEKGVGDGGAQHLVAIILKSFCSPAELTLGFGLFIRPGTPHLRSPLSFNSVYSELVLGRKLYC